MLLCWRCPPLARKLDPNPCMLLARAPLPSKGPFLLTKGDREREGGEKEREGGRKGARKARAHTHTSMGSCCLARGRHCKQRPARWHRVLNSVKIYTLGSKGFHKKRTDACPHDRTPALTHTHTHTHAHTHNWGFAPPKPRARLAPGSQRQASPRPSASSVIIVQVTEARGKEL